MKLSIIIPAYNEEDSVKKVLKELKELFKEEETEIICVNDGSIDKTEQEIKKVKGIKIVSYKKNLGKARALERGFMVAKRDWIATIDSDDSYPPRELKKLWEYTKKHPEHDMVIGSRFKKGLAKGLEWHRNLANIIGALVFSILFLKRVTDVVSGMRIFKKEIAKIKTKARNLDYEAELTGRVIKKRYNIKEIAIKFKERAGRSKLLFFRNIVLFTKAGIRGRWL